MANASGDSTSRLFAAVREAQDPALQLDDPHEHARARARLLQAIDRSVAARSVAEGSSGRDRDRDRDIAAASRGSGWRWGMATLAAAACAVAVMFAWPSDDTLEFRIDGTEVAVNQLIVADKDARALEFSDDTMIELAPGGRIRVSDLRSNGATVELERGEIALAVHHEDDTSWQVAAGPYAVHVTGTQFVVEWEPVAENFRVAVSEGSVRVEGPEGEIANLRAGDSLIRERGKATIEPESLEANETVQPIAQLDQPTADAGELADAGEIDEPESSETQPKPKPKAPTWTQHFDDADYQAAWEALEDAPDGIHGQAARAGADELLDLADVARFTRHRSDARKLLEQLRERFPASDEAGEAAFTLGRLAADGGSQAKAATWFELYLAEDPNGSFAGDALGRLIDSYEALERTADAKDAAQRYLARFPKGPHANKAKSIISE